MATNLGMATVDLGCPQLSMHSIREMCDSSGVHQASTLFKVSNDDDDDDDGDNNNKNNNK